MAGGSEFWRAHPGLVWSNPQASDAVHIRAALVRPRFHLLLDIAMEFGLPRLRAEWNILQTDDTPEVKRHGRPRFGPPVGLSDYNQNHCPFSHGLKAGLDSTIIAAV